MSMKYEPESGNWYQEKMDDAREAPLEISFRATIKLNPLDLFTTNGIPYAIIKRTKIDGVEFWFYDAVQVVQLKDLK
jgi:hypothetical protein